MAFFTMGFTPVAFLEGLTPILSRTAKPMMHLIHETTSSKSTMSSRANPMYMAPTPTLTCMTFQAIWTPASSSILS